MNREADDGSVAASWGGVEKYPVINDSDILTLHDWLKTHVVAGWKYEDLYALKDLVEDTPSSLGLSNRSSDRVGRVFDGQKSENVK